MRRLLIGSVAALGVFLLLAHWNSAVALVFGIGALAWIVSGLYWRSLGGDVFGDEENRR
jgi:glucose uptake protein GlcU